MLNKSMSWWESVMQLFLLLQCNDAKKVYTKAMASHSKKWYHAGYPTERHSGFISGQYILSHWNQPKKSQWDSNMSKGKMYNGQINSIPWFFFFNLCSSIEALQEFHGLTLQSVRMVLIRFILSSLMPTYWPLDISWLDSSNCFLSWETMVFSTLWLAITMLGQVLGQVMSWPAITMCDLALHIPN